MPSASPSDPFSMSGSVLCSESLRLVASGNCYLSRRPTPLHSTLAFVMSSAAAASCPRVYLDLDVDGHQAAYQRACEFVAATNFKYGWSSQILADLGGSERSRIAESYASDFEWSGKGRIELTPAAHTRLEIALYSEAAPNCADNFLHLCAGDKGKAKGSGVPLRYAGSHFHRYLPGQILQGGDFAHSNGSGGESIWGGRFKDDKAALKIKHSKRGLLSMCNTGEGNSGCGERWTRAGD